MNLNKPPKNNRVTLKRDKAPSTMKLNDEEEEFEPMINTNANSNNISPRPKLKEDSHQDLLQDPVFEAVLSIEEQKMMNGDTT